MNFNLKMSGEYKYTISRHGKIIQESDWFDNIILDSGLDIIGLTGAPAAYLCVGTGTSPPEVTQVALDQRIAYYNTSTTSVGLNSGSPDYIATCTVHAAFPQGSVVGTITEVGACNHYDRYLFSRALITDTDGNPTSISLIDIDQFTLYYKLRVIPTIQDTLFEVMINDITHSCISRLNNAGSFCTGWWFISNIVNKYYDYACSGPIKHITATPDGGSQSTVYPVMQPYIIGTHYVQHTSTWDINHGNFTEGIKAFVFYYGAQWNSHGYQVSFDPPIMKKDTQVLTLTVRFSWGR